MLNSIFLYWIDTLSTLLLSHHRRVTHNLTTLKSHSIFLGNLTTLLSSHRRLVDYSDYQYRLMLMIINYNYWILGASQNYYKHTLTITTFHYIPLSLLSLYHFLSWMHKLATSPDFVTSMITPNTSKLTSSGWFVSLIRYESNVIPIIPISSFHSFSPTSCALSNTILSIWTFLLSFAMIESILDD